MDRRGGEREGDGEWWRGSGGGGGVVVEGEW